MEQSGKAQSPGASGRQQASTRRKIKKKRNPYMPPLPSSAGKNPLPLILEEDRNTSSESECDANVCSEFRDLRVDWRSNIPNVGSKGTMSSSSKSSMSDTPLYRSENLVIRSARPHTLQPSGDVLTSKGFFNIPRKIYLPAQSALPPGSGMSITTALAFRKKMSPEALTASMASTDAIRSRLYQERRYLEAAVLSVLLLHHKVLVLPPLEEFIDRRDNAITNFPNDVAGKWCFGTDDILIFPGFCKDPSVLNFVLKEVVGSLKYLNSVEQTAEDYKIIEYREKAFIELNHDGYQVCSTLHIPGIPGFECFFKPVFTKRYFLLKPKDRIAAEFVHISLLTLHRLTEWAIHSEEYGIALAFAQLQHVADLCMRNYYPKPKRLKPFYPHTMTLWALGRVYCGLYDDFEMKSDLYKSFKHTWDKLHDLKQGLRSMSDVAVFENEGRFPETAEECLEVAGGFYRQVRVPGCWSVYNDQRNLTANLNLTARLRAWIANIDHCKPGEPVERKMPAQLLHELDEVLYDAEVHSCELASRTVVHEIVARCIAAKAARCKQQWCLCRAMMQQDLHCRHCIVTPLTPNFFGMQQRRSAHKAALVYAQRPLHPALRHALGGRLLRRVLIDSLMDTICALECKRNPRWITLYLKTFIGIAQTWHPPYKLPTNDELEEHYSTNTEHEFDGLQFESNSNLGPEHKSTFYPVMALFLYGLGISFSLLAQSVVKVRGQVHSACNSSYVLTVAAPLLRKRDIVAYIVEAFMEEANLYALFSVEYRQHKEVSEKRSDGSKTPQPAPGDLQLARKALQVKERLVGVFTTMRKLTYLLPLLYEYCIVIKTMLGPKNYPLTFVVSEPTIFPLLIFPTKPENSANGSGDDDAGPVEAEKYAVIRSLAFLRDYLGIEREVPFCGLQETDCPHETDGKFHMEFDISVFTSFSSKIDVLQLDDDGEDEKFVEERPMVYGKDFGMKYEVLAEGAPTFPLEDHYAKDQVNYSNFSTYTEDQYNKIFSQFDEEKAWSKDAKLEHLLAKLRSTLSLLTQTAIVDLKFLKKNSHSSEKVKFLTLKGDGFDVKEWKASALEVELSLLYQHFVDPEYDSVLLITSALYRLDFIINAGRMAGCLRGEFVL